MEELIGHLAFDRMDMAECIASLPERIRGYGHVKLASIEKAARSAVNCQLAHPHTGRRAPRQALPEDGGSPAGVSSAADDSPGLSRCRCSKLSAPNSPALRSYMACCCGSLATAPAWMLVAVQAVGACATAMMLGSERWWWLDSPDVHAAAAFAGQLGIAPGWYLGLFILLSLVHWSTFRTRVPLFLSNRATVDAVAAWFADRPAGSCWTSAAASPACRGRWQGAFPAGASSVSRAPRCRTLRHACSAAAVRTCDCSAGTSSRATGATSPWCVCLPLAGADAAGGRKGVCGNAAAAL